MELSNPLFIPKADFLQTGEPIMGAFAAAAAAQVRPSGNVGRESALLHRLLEADRQKPANCFYVNGVVREGIDLELDHPATMRFGQCQPALVLGERNYIIRDGIANRGCLYEDLGAYGVVRRAVLGTFDHNGRTFSVLQRPEGEPATLLVHVSFGMSDRARLVGIEPVWSGVRGGRVVMSDTKEALVEMKKEDSLLVFYPDGRVTRLEYGGILNFAKTGGKPHMLSPEDALDRRLELVDDLFKSAASKKELEQRVRAQDRSFHELAGLVALTGYYPELRKKLLSVVGHYVKELGSKLNPGAKKHFFEVLEALGEDGDAYWWLGRRLDASASVVVRHERKGLPTSVLARKKARAERDREAFMERTRGSAKRTDNNQNGGKKKGKKK